MLVEPVELKSAGSSSRSLAALRPEATLRNASADIRTVTPEWRRVTCIVPQLHRVTRTALFDVSSVWGPQEFFADIGTSGEWSPSGPGVTGRECSSFPGRRRQLGRPGRRVA